MFSLELAAEFVVWLFGKRSVVFGLIEYSIGYGVAYGVKINWEGYSWYGLFFDFVFFYAIWLKQRKSSK